MTVKESTVTSRLASSGLLLRDQIRYAVVAQWRSRVVLIFTIALAEARESRVLKRVRGTPLPAWTYLCGQIAAAVIFGVVSVVITLVLSVTLYDVEIRAETAFAMVTTLVIGMASFAAAGLAIAAIATSAAMAQAASIGSAVVLSFISGL